MKLKVLDLPKTIPFEKFISQNYSKEFCKLKITEVYQASTEQTHENKPLFTSFVGKTQ